jgi:hypothetical protein
MRRFWPESSTVYRIWEKYATKRLNRLSLYSYYKSTIRPHHSVFQAQATLYHSHWRQDNIGILLPKANIVVHNLYQPLLLSLDTIFTQQASQRFGSTDSRRVHRPSAPASSSHPRSSRDCKRRSIRWRCAAACTERSECVRCSRC